MSARRSQENIRCQVPAGLTDCRNRQADSRRDGWGCRRKEKNGANNLEEDDRENQVLEAIPELNPNRQEKPPSGFGVERAQTIRQMIPKNRQEALDSRSSFRDGAPLRYAPATTSHPLEIALFQQALNSRSREGFVPGAKRLPVSTDDTEELRWFFAP